MTFARTGTNAPNEYLPVGPVITQVSSNTVVNLFTMHKFDPALPWSEHEIGVKNEWSNPYSSYPAYNNKSNFTISISKDPRYSAVSASDNMVDANGDEENSDDENAGI